MSKASFKCPYGCPKQYSRERDLIRKHMRPVHATTQCCKPSVPDKPTSDNENFPLESVSPSSLAVSVHDEAKVEVYTQPAPGKVVDSMLVSPTRDTADVVQGLQKRLHEALHQLSTTRRETEKLRAYIKNEKRARKSVEEKKRNADNSVLELVREIILVLGRS